MRLARVIVGAVCLGLLGVRTANIFAAGAKTGGAVTIEDDLSFGNTGSCNLSGGAVTTLAGSLGQTGNLQSSGSGVTIDGGYFPFGGVAVKIWQGVPGGAASVGANWMGGVAPIAGDFVVFGSTNPGSACTWDLNITIASMSITGIYSSSITLTTDLTMTKGLDDNSVNTAGLDINGRNLSIQGDFVIGLLNTNSSVASSSITFYGNGDSVLKRTIATIMPFRQVVANKNAGFRLLVQSAVEHNENFTILGGTHVAGPFQHIFHKDIVINGGFVDVSQSTLTFQGAAPQQINVLSGGATPIQALFVWNSTTFTLPTPPVVGVFIATYPATNVIIGSGQTLKITSLTLNGQAAGTRIGFKSSSNGTQTNVKVTGSAAVDNAIIKDVNATSGINITANASVDAGGNVNWTFPGGGGGVPTDAIFDGSADDEARAVARSPNGDLYVVGYSSQGAQSKNIWLGKFASATMAPVTNVTLNGSGNKDDIANAVAVDGGGNVFAVGESSVTGLGTQIWLGKFNSSLGVISSMTFNFGSAGSYTATSGSSNTANGIAIAPNNNIFVVGSMRTGFGPNASTKIWLGQFTNNLVFVSSALVPNSKGPDLGFGIALDPSGSNVFITGSTRPGAGFQSDIWVGKFTNNFNFVSSTTRAGAAGGNDSGQAIVVNGGGVGVFVGGAIVNSGSDPDGWVGKFSPNGLSLLSETSINGSGNGNDTFRGIQLANAPGGGGENVILAGQTNETVGGDNIWKAEFNGNLGLISSATINLGSQDIGYGVLVDTIGGQSYVAGFVTNATKDIWLGRFGVNNSVPVFTTNVANIAPASLGPNAAGAGLLRVGLWTSGTGVTLQSLNVTLLGNAPSSNVTAKLYNGYSDGVFRSTDFVVGSQVFGSGFTPQAQLSFSPQALSATTQYFFVGVDLANVPAGKQVGVSIDYNQSFGLTNGFMPFQGGSFPLQSNQALVQLTLFANPAAGGYTTPTGPSSPNGGLDTGIFLQSGQNVVVSGSGSWVNNGGTTNANGVGSTGGLGAGLALGSLVGRIGGGAWQQLGINVSTLTTTQQGDLFLAMNSTTSSNDSGSIAINAQVLTSTVSKVWLGNSINANASNNANWLNGLPPGTGDTVVFGSTSAAINFQNCNWDIYSANIGLLNLTTGYGGVLTLAPAAYQLTVSSTVNLSSGTLSLGSAVTLAVQGNVNILGGVLDLGPGGGSLQMPNGGTITLSSGAFRSLGTTLVSVNSPSALSRFAFNVLGGSLKINNPAGTQFNNSAGVTVSTTAVTTGGDWSAEDLSFLSFINSSYNPAPALVLNAPMVARTWMGLSFDVNASTNVNASGVATGSTITLVNSAGIHLGSPFAKDTNRVLVWSPDGGAAATVTGTISAAVGFGSAFTLQASTDRFGGGTSSVLFSTGTGSVPQSFTLSNLTAPNTWYFTAWRTAGAFPTGFDPRGGYGFPGFLNSSPVFLAANASVANVNITVSSFGVVSGNATNNSPQSGPVVVEAWAGVPYLSTSTLAAKQFSGGAPIGNGGSIAYSLSVPATGLYLLSYVDLNGSGVADAFEASGTSSVVTSIAGSTLSGIPISITGGSAPPGGTLNVGTVNPFPAHSGFAGTAGPGQFLPQAMLRLDLSAAVSSVTWNNLRVDVVGATPQLAYNLGLWRDDAANGTFDNSYLGGGGPFDTQLASVFLSGGPSSGTINFPPETLIPGTTRTYFVTLDLQGQFAQPLGLRLVSTGYFSLSQGAGAVQTSTFPINSGVVPVKGAVFAYQQPYLPSSGGQNTGQFYGAGQTAAINSISGTWKINASSAVTGAGVTSTQGQATIVPAANIGQVIGRIGDFSGNGTTWFAILSGTPFTAGATGNLFLAQNNFPGNYLNASGAVFADFGVSGSTTGVIVGTVTYAGGISSGNLFVRAAVGTNGPIVSTATLPMSVGTTQYFYTIGGLGPGSYTVDAFVGNSPGQTGSFPNPIQVVVGATATGKNFAMSLGQGTISGKAFYSGIQGFGNFLLAASTSAGPGFQGSIVKSIIVSSGVTYNLSNLPSPNTYYLVAFRDGNFNNLPDGAEAVGVRGNSAGPLASTGTFTAIFVDTAATVSGQDVTLLDRGAMSGSVNGTGAISNTSIIVVAGHGFPGSAGFAPENRQQIFIGPSLPASWSLGFNLGLLRPATDYSLLAFIDSNFNGVFDLAENFGQLNGPLTVSSAGFTNASVTINPPQPPPPVTGFTGQSLPTAVLWSWNGVPGASVYNLKNSSGGLVAAVSGLAFNYTEIIATNTFSTIVSIQSSNTFGASALIQVPPVASLAAQIAAAPTFPGVFQTSLTLDWSTTGNSTATLYQVLRATSSPGQFFVAATTSSPQNLVSAGFTDAGLVPGAQYFYQITALNLNGVASAPSPLASRTTAGAGGTSSISGTVKYAGTQKGGVVVQAFTSTVFTPTSATQAPLAPSTSQQYFVPVAPSASYYLRAFIDVQGTQSYSAGEDLVSTGPIVVGAGAPFPYVTVTIINDTLAPGAPTGLTSQVSLGSVNLSWSSPTVNSNGTPLFDLAGFQVQRATLSAGPFAILSSGTVLGSTGTIAQTFLMDFSPVPGVVNYYRVLALDYAGLQSLPSSLLALQPNTGGSVAGTLQYKGTTSQGAFRVRLSTNPAPGSLVLAEIAPSSGPFAFTGLTDGNYFVRAFRDVDGDSVVGDGEPVGTLGGIGQPYPVFIFNSSSFTTANFQVCDRTAALFGTPTAPSSYSGTTSGGCPAADQGTGFFTKLYSFRVGGGGAGSVGAGSQISIVMQSTFTRHVLLLGPDGGVVAQDSPSGSGVLKFTVNQPGTYMIEPTSFNPGTVNTGSFTLNLNQTGGFAGGISGGISYSGAQAGKVVVQLFNNPNANAQPLTISTLPAPGAYSLPSLPDGFYYLRSFRDSNANLSNDPGEASGVFGVSASSLTAIIVQGGLTFVNGTQMPPNSVSIQLTDPAVGSVTGQVLRQGTITGTIRIEVGTPAPCTGCGIGVVAFATIPAAGSFTVPFIAPATNYVVQAYVDQNANSFLDSLEPAVSTSPISVAASQATTLNFLVSDPGSGGSGNATISGTISYAGTATGTVRIGFATDSSFLNIPYFVIQTSTGAYLKSGMVGGTSYYIGAFIDVNNNSAPDPNLGEPIGSYAGGSPLFAPQSGTLTADFTLNDSPNGAITGAAAYSGAAPLSQNIVVQGFIPGAASGAGTYNSQKAVIARAAGVSQYNYNLPFLAAATNYSVIAFVDANASGQPDPGEPFAFFGQPVCTAGGQCFSSPVAVSSGTGSFAAAGTNMQIYDPGGCSGGICLGNTGTIFGDLIYLGTQGGPIVVRVFTSPITSTATPQVTFSTSGPAGPGAFHFNISNLALNATYYLDAFRDPAFSGVFNPSFDAYGVLNAGQGVLLTQAAPNQAVFGDTVIDPGQGGSVNAYTGGFGVAAGARFDGGATDIGTSVAVDTASPGAPLVYVAGVTAQNSGVVNSLVKYDSSGVKLASATVPAGIGLSKLSVDYTVSPARLYVPGRQGGLPTLFRYDAGLRLLNQVQLNSALIVKGTALNNGVIYVAVGGSSAGQLVRKIDPLSAFATVSTGTYQFPTTAPGFTNAQAVAVDTNTGNVYVVAVFNSNNANILAALLKFGPNLNFSGLPQVADISSLGIPESVSLAVDGAGNVFLSFASPGQGAAKTFKFNSNLQQVASAVFSPILVHLSGAATNLGLDAAGHVYEAWEAPVNGGDYLTLHYDNNLNLVASQTFDGNNGLFEDLAAGLAVQDSTNVYVTGATNNGANLDWATLRLNMNNSGANIAPPPPPPVVVLSSAIVGTVAYGGTLMTSGTIRTNLFALGGTTPLRVSTAAFGSSGAYVFNNIPSGFYQVKSFIDANSNFSPDAGEAVAQSTATGLAFVGGVITQNLKLCDRRSIAVNTSITDTITPADCPSPDRGGAFQRLYTFQGAVGQSVNIQNDAVNFYDSAFNLYDPNGSLIASGSDAFPDANARLKNFALPSGGLYTIGASPFAPGLSSATFKLTLGDSAGTPGSIAGNITYSGVQGGAFIAALFSTTTFSGSTLRTGTVVSKVTLPGLGGGFTFSNLLPGTSYYAGAFVDVNANQTLDSGEDSGFFGSSVTGPATIFLQSGQDLTGVNFDVGAALSAQLATATVSGVISYTGIQTGNLRVELWSNASFTGAPIGVRLLTGPGAYDVPVPGNAGYYIRAFIDLNASSTLDANEPFGFYSVFGQGADLLFVKASTSNINVALKDPGQGSGTTGAAGDGAANVSSITAQAGGAFSTTIVYTVGLSSIQVGGTLGFIMPQGFAPPQSVTLAADGGNTGNTSFSSVTLRGNAAFADKLVGTANNGDHFIFTINKSVAPCVLSSGTFIVAASQNLAAVPQPLISLSTAPLVVSVTQGSAATFAPSVPYFSVTQYQLSAAQSLEAQDVCGNKVSVAGSATVPLRAKVFNQNLALFQNDPTVVLATSTLLLNPSSSVDVTFSAGQSSAAFYVQSFSSGVKNIELVNLAVNSTFYFGFTALPANALTNVSVSTVPFGLGQSNATISPNGDPSTPDLAYINFDLGNANINWHILVSSLPFRDDVTPTPIWDLFGTGQPSRGQVAWGGRFSTAQGGARAPNGVYYVRIELAAQVHDDTLVVTVNTPQISGKVADAGTTPSLPLTGVTLVSFGPFGSGSFATDGSGNYVLPGLAPGSYQLQLTRQDYLLGQASMTINGAGAVSGFGGVANVAVSTNASGGLDFLMQRAPTLFVFPNAPQGALGVGLSTQSFDQFGTLQVNLSTGCGGVVIASSGSFSATLRLPKSTNVFDDGGQWDPTLQASVAHTFFKFQVAQGTYAVTAALPGFSPVCFSQFVGQGASEVDVSSSFFTVQKSSVSGLVTFAANPNGAAVTVVAAPFPAASTGTPRFVSVSLTPGVLQASYTVTNLDPGNYILRASVAGSSDSFVGPIIVPLAVPGSPVNFPTFGAGAAINGAVTVNADTTGRSLQLSVSAWAPGALNVGSTVTYKAGGASGTAIPYTVSGLDAGTTYQIYANLSYGSGINLDTLSQMPALSTAPATVNFTFVRSSGSVAGTILLPAGSTDFANVALSGVVFASPRPDQVGRLIATVAANTLPNFACTPVACNGVVGSSTATFSVQGLNTETDDITFFYKTTGQSRSSRVSVVNGSTTTIFVNLSSPTFAITGIVTDQASTSTFNTMYSVVHTTVDVPLLDLSGSPVAVDPTSVPRSTASLARVLAIRQDIAGFTTALSTSFNPATSRVGFMSENGTYTITNLPAGVYLVRTEGLRACPNCAVLVPSVAQVVHVNSVNVSSVNFTLTDGFGVSGTISLEQGILDSQAFTLTVTDHRQQVVASSAVFMGDSTLNITANSAAYSFANLPPGDFYTLTVKGTTYAGRPIRFPDAALSPNGLQGDLTGQNVLMQPAAYFVGRLQDANSGAFITAANAALLAPNFTIAAKANPWVEGGFVTAVSSVAGRPISGDDYFHVGPLIPKIAYDLTLSQTNWDLAFLAQGSQNYAPVTLGGLTPQPGETKDLGVIQLNQGQSLSGTICQSTMTACQAGAPLLGNIKVTAVPTFGNSGLVSQTFTNPQGRYTLWVSTYLSNQYEVTAAPPEGNTASNGVAYGQTVRHGVNLATTTAITADFQLGPLPLAVTGQVVVIDSATGGDLSYPFGDKKGFPAAAVNLQSTGTVATVDPLGDITAVTDEQGRFSVSVATLGAFNLRASSLGYKVCKATAVVTASGVTISGSGDAAKDGCNILAGNVLQLIRGATLTGRILKGDGSAPSDSEVGGIAAANFNTSPPEFLVGSVAVDPNAKTVNSYTITGFKSGVSYDVVILPKDKTSGVFAPPEGSSVTFANAQSSTTKTIDLTYLPPSFDCQATARSLHESSGTVGITNTHWIDQFQITVDCSKGLRSKIDADSDLSKLLSVSDVTAPWISTQPIPVSLTPQPNAPYVPSGGVYGHFLGSEKNLSGDRRHITAIYRVDISTPNFSVSLKACSGEVNPKTGDNFCLTKIFDFYELLKSHSAQNVSNIQGGVVTLVPTAQDESVAASTSTDNTNNEHSSIAFAPGTFAVCTASSTDECDSGGDNANDKVDTSTSVKVGMSKTTDPTEAKKKIHEQGLSSAPMELSALTRPGYVPARLAAAAASLGACSVPGPNPLSSFYDIFLPATVRHQLRQAADLTLSFNVDVSTWSQADLDKLHVWHLVGGGQKCADGSTSASGLCCDGTKPQCGYCVEDNNRRVDLVNKTITVKVNSLSPFLVGTTPALTAPGTFTTSDILAFNFPNPVDCIQHSNLQGDTNAGFALGAVHNFFGTRVRYTLPVGPTSDMAFNIYNVSGQLIQHSLAPRAGGGTYYDDWDCSNQTGHQVASGVYIGEIVWGGKRTFFKIAIIRGSGL